MLAYFGGCNSGDRSQSLMWAAVSAFRAPQKQFSGHAHQEEKRIPRAPLRRMRVSLVVSRDQALSDWS